MKEFIVTLKKEVDAAAFFAEMDQAGSDSPRIPVRSVEVSDFRPLFPRKRHYLLTDQEAANLRLDPRVLGVDLPVEQDPLVTVRPWRVEQTRNNFSKPSNLDPPVGSNVNWGLVRNSSLYNVYGENANTSVGYGYFVDGTGVDVVFIDSGIEATHPEFQEVGSSTSRLQQIDWFVLSGVPGTMPHNFYTDYAGHGTITAATAAGKTYGWAKNAHIFAIKMAGLEGPGDPGTGLTWTQAMDVLMGWHQNKMNPSSPYYTGRPTVINFAFAYGLSIVGVKDLVGGQYRGVIWTGSSWYDPSEGLTFANSPTCPARISSVDSDLDDLITAGMTCCVAANDNGLKIDIPGGVDYDNSLFYLDGGFLIGPIYYMRGSSPYSTSAIMVGGMDSTPINATTDQKTESSSAGPGVDIFAAAANIISACSNVNLMGGEPYYWDASYDQAIATGTSLAASQITGISSLYLQNNLDASPANVKAWLVDNGTYTIRNTGADNDYGDTTSQWGGNAPVAFSNSQGPLVKITANNWAATANVLVKNSGNTWTAVQNIWTKVDATTWKQIY